jgi:hypothetical protein
MSGRAVQWTRGVLRRKADAMEFSVTCPNDGPIEVGLEAISTIIFRGFETVTVIFVCPRCGAEIQVGLQIPDIFITAVEVEPSEMPFALDDDLIDAFQPFARHLEHTERAERSRVIGPVEQRRIDGYCEYFRRQLATVDDVDEVLAEIDDRPR